MQTERSFVYSSSGMMHYYTWNQSIEHSMYSFNVTGDIGRVSNLAGTESNSKYHQSSINNPCKRFSCMNIPGTTAICMPCCLYCCLCPTVCVSVFLCDCRDVGKSEAQAASWSGPPRPLWSGLNPHESLFSWVGFGRCCLAELFSLSTHTHTQGPH